jgi:hypothetical protein
MLLHSWLLVGLVAAATATVHAYNTEYDYADDDHYMYNYEGSVFFDYSF